MKRPVRGNKPASFVAAATALVAGLLVAPAARSDPRAPAYLQGKYGLSCTPDCTLCHGTTAGGIGNYRLAKLPNGQLSSTEGFILALKNCNFQPTADFSNWDAAFAQCEASKVDSDHDGTPDVEELKAGTDPNDATVGAEICGNGPTYGCVRVARGGSVGGVALLVSSAVLFLGVALARRRGR